MESNIKKLIHLVFFALIVKGLGFLREVLVAYYYGTSVTSDVFITALNIPSVIFALFGTAITTAFIPLFSEISIKGSEEEAIDFANNALNILTILSLAVSVLGILFSNVLVEIFAGGFTDGAYTLCNDFVKITMITIVMTVIQYIYNSFLQTKGQFDQQSLMNVPYNLLLIGAVVLSFYLENFYILAYGAVCASLSQLIYLRVLIKKTSFKHKKILNFRDSNIRRMLILIGPVFLSTAVNQLNSIVDRNLASGLKEGSISALNYSNKVNSIVLEVIIISVATIAYPTLARLSAEGNVEAVDRFIQSLLSCIGLLVIPVSIFVGFFSEDVIALLYGRGAFGEDEVRFVAKALVFLSLGLMGVAFRDILNRVFYAMQDTVTPVRNGIISVLLNIILNLILVRRYAYLGLAFATMFSANLCTFLLLIEMFRKKKELKVRFFIIDQLKIIVSTILTFIVACFAKIILNIEGHILNILIMGLLIIVSYIFCLFLLKENIVCDMIAFLKKVKSRN